MACKRLLKVDVLHHCGWLSTSIVAISYRKAKPSSSTVIQKVQESFICSLAGSQVFEAIVPLVTYRSELNPHFARPSVAQKFAPCTSGALFISTRSQACLWKGYSLSL